MPIKLRILFLSILLMVCTLLPCQAQNASSDWLSLPADSLSALLDNLPEFCTRVGHASWHVSSKENLGVEIKSRLAVIHFGNFADTRSNHNARVLQDIQNEFNKLSAVLIAIPQAGLPANDADVKLMSRLHALRLPLLIDHDGQLAQCNSIAATPTTLLLSPAGKVLRRYEGVVNYVALKEEIASWYNHFTVLQNTDQRPYAPPFEAASLLKPILECPMGIEKNANDFQLFVSDFCSNRIWVISNTGDVIDIIGTAGSGHRDGNWAEAAFNGPWGLAWDEPSKALYVADHYNHVIRKLDFVNKTVSTVLGTGDVADAGDIKGVGRNFNLPLPTFMSLSENQLRISSSVGIWQVDTRTEVAERLLTTGTVQSEETHKPIKVEQPSGLAMDRSGNLFFAERPRSSIQQLESNGSAKRLIGKASGVHGMSNNRRSGITLNHPMGMTLYEDKLYIADAYNHSIRTYDPYKNRAETLAGDGTLGDEVGNGNMSRFSFPTDVAALQGMLYVCDTGNGLLRSIDLNTGATKHMPLYNYDALSSGMQEPVAELRDLDTLFLQAGDNHITWRLQLDEAYQYDQSGASTLGITSRHDSLFVSNTSPNEGLIEFNYRPEPEKLPNDIVIDAHMYIKLTEQSARQYYRGISFIIPVLVDPKRAQTKAQIEVFLNPALRSGGPIAPEGQKFMD